MLSDITKIPSTGVPHSQETPSSQDPMVGLCIRLHGCPKGVGVSDEGGTPVLKTRVPDLSGSTDPFRGRGGAAETGACVLDTPPAFVFGDWGLRFAA